MTFSSPTLPQKQTVTDMVLTIMKGTSMDMMQCVVACIVVLAGEIDKAKAVEADKKQ